MPVKVLVEGVGGQSLVFFLGTGVGSGEGERLSELEG